MGVGASKETVESLIEEVDFDGTGQIEWVKFLMVRTYYYIPLNTVIDSKVILS